MTRDLKDSGKLGLLDFSKSWIHKTGLIFDLADFHGWNWRISGFALMRKNSKLSNEHYYPLKPTEVGFIFRSRSCQSLESSELVLRLSLKAGFKELRLEPKLLSRGLRENLRMHRIKKSCSKNFRFDEYLRIKCKSAKLLLLFYQWENAARLSNNQKLTRWWGESPW